MSSLTETDAPGLAADHVEHVERLWRTVKSIQATEPPETLLGVAKRDYRDLTRALYIVKAARRGRHHALHLRSHEERMALEEVWEEQVQSALDDMLPLIDVDAAWHEAHRGWPSLLDPSDGIIVGEIGVVKALLENTVRKAIGPGDKVSAEDMKAIEGWGGQRTALAKRILKTKDAVVLRTESGLPYAVAEMERATGNISVRTLVVSPEAQHHGQDALREIAIEAAHSKSHLHIHPRSPAQENYLARLGFVKNVPLPAGAPAAGGAAFTPAAEEAMLMTVDVLTQVVQQNGFSPFPQTRAGVQAALASGVNYDSWARGAYSRYIGMAAQTAEQAGQMSMEHLGLDKTFAFAHPQNMANDMFSVRGSKVIQQMYGEHMNKLTQIIMDATSPKAPLTIQETTKHIKAQWPKLTKYQAVRIARTETAAVWMHTSLNAYAANGVSEWESIVAKGPSIEVDAQGACGFCSEMAAHTHSMDDVHLPPYHPHCRCDVVPVLEDPTTGEPWLPPDEPWAGGSELGVSAGLPGVGKLVAAPEPGVPLGGPLTFTSHVLPKPAERAALKADVQAWPEHVPGGAPTASIKVAAQEMLDSTIPVKAMRTGLGNATGVATYHDGFMLPNMGRSILVHRIETATGDRYAMLRGFAEDAYRGKTDWLAIETEWLPAVTRKRLTSMGFEPVPYQPGILRLRTADLPERFKFDPTDVVPAPPAPVHAPPIPDAPPLIPTAPPPPPPRLTFEEVTDVAAFNARIATSPYKDFIAVHSPEEIAASKTRLFVSKDGNVTFSVTGTGDIQNVVALPGAPKGVGGQAVEEAIRQGGTHLDAYDGFLPDFYAGHGFKATGHMRWADEYAPDGWDYAKFGRPDVVFMSLAREGTEARLAAKVLFEDWDAAKGWSSALGRGATINEARELAFAESGLAKLADEGSFYLNPLGGTPDKLQRYRVVTDGSESVLVDPPTTADLAAYFAANLVHVQAKGKLKGKLFFQGRTDDAGRTHLGVGTSFRQLPSAKAFAEAHNAQILDTKTGKYVETKTPDVGPAPPEPLPPDIAATIHAKGLDQWPPNKGPRAVEILGDESDTVGLYRKNGVWAQEREALHRDIIERHFEGKVEAVGQPTAYFTSGGGAAGKSHSTFRVGDKDVTLNELKTSPDVVVIDPDAIKTMLPEFQDIAKAGDAYASFAVHEESKALARAVKQLAQQRGYNVVIDTTGSGKSFVGKLQGFRDAGYRIEVTMTSIPTREAVIRSVKRGEQTGRYVAVHALSRAHREASRAFLEWRDASYVDEWRLFDNTGGERVLMAERKAGTAEVAVYDDTKLTSIEHKAGEPDVEVSVAPEVPTKLSPPPPPRSATVPPPEAPPPGPAPAFPSTKPIEGMSVEFTQVGGSKAMPQVIRYMNVDDVAGHRVGMINYRVDADGINIDGIAVNRAQQGKGVAAAMVVRLREELGGNQPIIHGSFSSPEGAGFGVYMSARYPEWNKLWARVDADGTLVWWRPGDPLKLADPDDVTATMDTFGPMPFGKYSAAQQAVDDAVEAANRALAKPATTLEEPPAPLAPDGYQNASSAEADDAHKVYSAEGDVRLKFGVGNKFVQVKSTFEQQASAERYAQEVWERNKDLWAGNIERPQYVYVQEGLEPNHSELQYVTEGGATIYPRITLGDNMRDQLTVLHETAHAMFGPVLQHDVGHGREFQEMFVLLLRREMSETHADLLAGRLGIEVAHVPKPFEPIGPPVKDWAWADGEVRRPVNTAYAPGYEEWYSGLSGSQLAAVKEWTEGTTATGLNAAIRESKELTETQTKSIQALDSLIAKAPTYSVGSASVTVWRGVTLDGTWEGVDDAALLARLQEEFPVGSTIHPQGYQASSFSPDVALDASLSKSNIGVVFEIKTRNGAVLKDMSKFQHEDELLLSRVEEWDVKRITRETFEHTDDGKQIERFVIQIEARPPTPTPTMPQKLSPEPFQANVVAIDDGLKPERADWLRAQTDEWSNKSYMPEINKLVDDAEDAGGELTKLIELRDDYSRLRGITGIAEYEGATFAKSIATVTHLFPDSSGNINAVKQMINTAANLTRAHYTTIRIDSSKVFLAGDEWDELALWAKARGWDTDGQYWSAKVDDLVTPMRLDEVKQFDMGWNPPKITPMSPEVIGGLHVEVTSWPGAKGAKELLQRAAQDKKMELKVIRDEGGALESLAASKTVTDLSGKPLTTAEVYTSTGEPLVDIIPSLVDDAQAMGARLEIVSNEALTSGTLMALGMKRVEGTKRWYANQNDLDVVRLRAEAAEGSPLFGTPKPVPEAAPAVAPAHEWTYHDETIGAGETEIHAATTIKLAEEARAAFEPSTASIANNMLSHVEGSYSRILVVRNEHGKLAGIARWEEDVPNGEFKITSFYTDGAAGAEDKLMVALVSRFVVGPRDRITINTYQVRASDEFLGKMSLKGFKDNPEASLGGELVMSSKKDVNVSFSIEPVKPPLAQTPLPPTSAADAPLEVVQMEGAAANPDVLDALREEAGKWIDATRADALLQSAETFPSLAVATIRTTDGQLDGLVGFAEWSDMKRIGIVDNLIMRNSDDLETTLRLLAIPARRAFDRGWKMTIQNIDSSGLPTIDYGLQQRLVAQGAKEIDAGASGKYLEMEAKDLGAAFDLDSVKYGVPTPTAAVPGVQKLPTAPESLGAPAKDPYGGADLSDAPPKVEVAAFTDQPTPSTAMTDVLASVERWTEEAAKKDAKDLLTFVSQQDGVGLVQVRKGDYTSALAAYSYSGNNVVIHQLASPWLRDDASNAADALAAEFKIVFGLAKMASSPPRALVFDTVMIRPELRKGLEAWGFKTIEYTDPTFGPARVFGITYDDAAKSGMLDNVSLPESSPLLRAEAAALPERGYTPLSHESLNIAKRVEDGDFPPVTPGGVTKEAGTSKMSKDLTEGIRDRGVVGLKQDVQDLIDSRLREDPGWHPEVVKDLYNYGYGRYSQDTSKDIIAQLVNNWAITSSDADWRGVAIQIAVKEELGLGDVRAFAASYWRLADEEKNLKVVEEAMRKLNDNPALRTSLHAFVRAQYEETQRYLKEIDVDEVTIYRGLSVTKDDPAIPWGVGLNVTPSTDNPVASWSFRHNTARRGHFFGGTMFRASVPREMIFSFPRTGFGCADNGEAEVLVINTGHNRVWVSQEGEIPLDQKALRRLADEKERLNAEWGGLRARYDKLQEMNDGAGPIYGTPERTELYEVREQMQPLQNRISEIDRAFQKGSIRHEYERETELRQLIEQALIENPSLAGKAIKPPGWTAQQWKSVGTLREQVEALAPEIERRVKYIEALQAETKPAPAAQIPDAKTVREAKKLIATNQKELDALLAQQAKLEAKIETIEEAVQVKATGYTVAEAKEADKLRNMISGLDEQIIQIKAPSIAAKYAAERDALQARLTVIEKKVAARVAAKVVSPAVAKTKAEITSLKRKITFRQKKIEKEYEGGFNPEANLQLTQEAADKLQLPADAGRRISFKDWLESKGKAEYEELPYPSPSPLDAGKTLYTMKRPPLEVMRELMTSGEVQYPPWWWQRVETYRKQVENLEGQLARAEERLAQAQAAAVAKARYTEGMRRLRKRAGL